MYIRIYTLDTCFIQGINLPNYGYFYEPFCYLLFGAQIISNIFNACVFSLYGFQTMVVWEVFPTGVFNRSLQNISLLSKQTYTQT